MVPGSHEGPQNIMYFEGYSIGIMGYMPRFIEAGVNERLTKRPTQPPACNCTGYRSPTAFLILDQLGSSISKWLGVS